jgi:hypothetical protein
MIRRRGSQDRRYPLHYAAYEYQFQTQGVGQQANAPRGLVCASAFPFTPMHTPLLSISWASGSQTREPLRSSLWRRIIGPSQESTALDDRSHGRDRDPRRR